MITLRKLTLKNYVLFKHAELDLDYNGITVIRGNNTNIKHGNNTNAVGKSLLLSALPQLLLNEPVLPGNKSAQISSGTQHLELDVNGTEIILARTPKPELYIDGENQTQHRQADTLDKIQSVINITDEELFTTIYLDSRRPSLLQYGTASTRYTFLTNLYRQHGFDEIRTHINSEITQLSKLEAQRLALLTERGRLEKDKIEDPTSFKQKLADLETRERQLKERLSRYTRQKDQYRLAVKYQQQVTTLKQILDKDFTDIDDELMREIDAAIKMLETDVKAAEYTSNYTKARKSVLDYKEATVSFREPVSDLLEKWGNPSGPELDEYVGKYEYKIKKAREDKKLLTRELASAKRELANLPELEPLETRLTKDPLFSQTPEELKTWRNVLNERLTALESHSGSTCRVCGQALSEQQANKLIQSVRRDLEKIAVISKHKKIAVERERLERNLGETRQRLDKVEALLDKDALDDILAYRRAAARYADKLEQFRSQYPYKPDDSTAHIDVATATATIQKLQQAKHQARALQAVDVPNLDSSVTAAELEDKIQRLQDKLREVSATLPQMYAQKLAHNRVRQRQKEIKQDLTDISTQTRDLPVWKLLQKAYGNADALKTRVLKHLADQLERAVNQHASLLFPEPIKFEFQVQGSAKFAILATREVKNNLSTCDVRHLSGAESKSFNLLVMLSVLTLIPSSRRTNIVVLDEMTANMDDARKTLFLEEFLPTLNQIVPHIIVITPGTEIIPGAREITVTKTGQTAELVYA
jgi:hypothetical protein